jgi:hypothetical protein
MANAAAGAGTASGGSSAGGSGGMGSNPFQIATNLYAEKNLQGAQSGLLLTGSAITGGGSINAGQYLRALRLMYRTVTAGATGTSLLLDGPFSVFSQLDLTNVDGSEILYNMGGYAYYSAEKYFRPWLTDPAKRYDFTIPSATSGGSFTLSLQPEIRFTAGVLANTDTRSQYRFDYALNGAGLGSYATYPTVALVPYMDAWAQPDAQDLQGTPNQPVPPGVNLQVKRRHQIFTMNGTGSDNTFLSTLTGNALRGMIIVTRNSSNVRVDGLSDPIYWQLDNRSLGRLNPDIVRQWQDEQYNTYGLYGTSTAAPGASGAFSNNNASDGIGATGLYAGAGGDDLGTYVFPRFMNPGDLYGQGWLYTANSTKLQWESSTLNSAATAELITDEVYPVGAVDPSLVDI